MFGRLLLYVQSHGVAWSCTCAARHTRSVDGLPFPRADLVWVKLVLRSDLLHGLVATQRFQRRLGFKLICKIPAQRHSRIPSKVWDTPWLTVQFSGTTSADAFEISNA